MPPGPVSGGRHARRPAGREIGVRLAWYEGRLRVEVADASRARPPPKTAAADDGQGRGLAIISALSMRWGRCPRLSLPACGQSR
ncbi:ATP-binding protein [Streptomyces sp. SCL15-4]|uniref:ATP-binding protein n=1 Tax=Streptomyces sp. SCL15-4 TaxID=2967221 RepID=UPI0029672003|nr:ATP-binding protein [Streptomyces sp. SCL15-4]